MGTLCVVIDDALLRQLRCYVIATHGKLHGQLGPEIETAIANHLRRGHIQEVVAGA